MISKETQALIICVLLQHEEHGGDYLECRADFCERTRADLGNLILMEARLEALLRAEAA